MSIERSLSTNNLSVGKSNSGDNKLYARNSDAKRAKNPINGIENKWLFVWSIKGWQNVRIGK